MNFTGSAISQPTSPLLPTLCSNLTGNDERIKATAAKQIYLACICPQTTPAQVICSLFPLLPGLASDGKQDIRISLACQLPSMAKVCVKWEHIDYSQYKPKGKVKLPQPPTGVDVVAELLFPVAAALAISLPQQHRFHAINAASQMAALLTPTQALEATWSHILPLCHATADEPRVAALALLAATAPYLPRALSSSTLTSELCFASDDTSSAIRTAAAQAFADLAACVGPTAVSSRLWPFFQALSRDSLWSVRLACANALPSLARSLDAPHAARLLLPLLFHGVRDAGFVSQAALALSSTLAAALPILPPAIVALVHRTVCGPNADSALLSRITTAFPALLAASLAHPVVALCHERSRVIRGGSMPFSPSPFLPPPSAADAAADAADLEDTPLVEYPRGFSRLALCGRWWRTALSAQTLNTGVCSAGHIAPDDAPESLCACPRCVLECLSDLHLRVLALERPLAVLANTITAAVVPTATDRCHAPLDSCTARPVYTLACASASLASLLPSPLAPLVLTPLLRVLARPNINIALHLAPQFSALFCAIPPSARHAMLLAPCRALYAEHVCETLLELAAGHPLLGYQYHASEYAGHFTHLGSAAPASCARRGKPGCVCSHAQVRTGTVSTEAVVARTHALLSEHYGVGLPDSDDVDASAHAPPAPVFTPAELDALRQARRAVGVPGWPLPAFALDRLAVVSSDSAGGAPAVPTLASLLGTYGQHPMPPHARPHVPWRVGVTVLRQLSALAAGALGADAYWMARGADVAAGEAAVAAKANGLDPTVAATAARASALVPKLTDPQCASRPPSCTLLLTLHVLALCHPTHTLKLRLEAATHMGPLLAAALSLALANCHCHSPATTRKRTASASALPPELAPADDSCAMQSDQPCGCVTGYLPCHSAPPRRAASAPRMYTRQCACAQVLCASCQWHRGPWALLTSFLASLLPSAHSPVACDRDALPARCPHPAAQIAAPTSTPGHLIFLTAALAARPHLPPVVFSWLFLTPMPALLRHRAPVIRARALLVTQDVLAAYRLLAYTAPPASADAENATSTDRPEHPPALPADATTLCHCTSVAAALTAPLGPLVPSPVAQDALRGLSKGLCCLYSAPLASALTHTPTDEHAVAPCGCLFGVDLADHTGTYTRCSPLGIRVGTPPDSPPDSPRNDTNTQAPSDDAGAVGDAQAPQQDREGDGARASAEGSGYGGYRAPADSSVCCTEWRWVREGSGSGVPPPRASALWCLFALCCERAIDVDSEVVHLQTSIESFTKHDVPPVLSSPFATLLHPYLPSSPSPAVLSLASGVGDLACAHLLHAQQHYLGAAPPPPLTPSSLPAHDYYGVTSPHVLPCIYPVADPLPQLAPLSAPPPNPAPAALSFGHAPCGCGSAAKPPVALVPYASAPNDATLSPRALAGLSAALMTAQARADMLACVYWPLQLWLAMHAAAHRHGLSDVPLRSAPAADPPRTHEEHKDEVPTDAPTDVPAKTDSPVAATTETSASALSPRDVLDTGFVLALPSHPGLLARESLHLERAWLRAVCGPAGEEEDGVSQWEEVLSYVDEDAVMHGDSDVEFDMPEAHTPVHAAPVLAPPHPIPTPELHVTPDVPLENAPMCFSPPYVPPPEAMLSDPTDVMCPSVAVPAEEDAGEDHSAIAAVVAAAAAAEEEDTFEEPEQAPLTPRPSAYVAEEDESHTPEERAAECDTSADDMHTHEDIFQDVEQVFSSADISDGLMSTHQHDRAEEIETLLHEEH